ncbi:hypothetical protein P691DRAFT_810101 [Macrolepiota fuliginosa MF-IS2]|uniref:Uncharacterized protein n=1 Tax=Macrolepiota fuliginosa MF-IS2 TaxID=1400762 RepID=A0A9P5XHN9_9AGAR|nr:hypothetical protein P691DRAFT_810101 [Macrolepiota fuliginosa MF-IS2]
MTPCSLYRIILLICVLFLFFEFVLPLFRIMSILPTLSFGHGTLFSDSAHSALFTW